MSDSVRILLHPQGRAITVPRGAALQTALFDEGFEFPCGARGRCRGCRARLLEGAWAPNPAETAVFSPLEIEQGWRLACQGYAENDMTLEAAQWDMALLSDHRPFAFTPREGLAAAVDLGTTTIAAQWLDRRDGRVLASKGTLNPQAKYGADIMSRIHFAVAEGGLDELRDAVREAVFRLLRDSLPDAIRDGAKIAGVTLAGNTAMQHLFCGEDVTPLSVYPFEPRDSGERVFAASSLGWTFPEDPPVRILPSLGGFVGSDALAGILAFGLHEREELGALIDLGTNGEIVVGDRERMLCASTAAGPAFEGGGVSVGMRAVSGAIYEARAENGELRCETLGGGPARGVCGSGLVDAAATALDLGWLLPSGRLTTERGVLRLRDEIALTNRDIRQLQLAKGAITAGLKVLLERLGVRVEETRSVALAGAFGACMNPNSATRIGLLPFPNERVTPIGNAALRGTKMALFDPPEASDQFSLLRSRIEHVSLHADPDFQERFMEEMAFPHR